MKGIDILIKTKDALEEFVMDRIEEIGIEILVEDAKYNEHQEKAIDLFEKLLQVLPEDHKKLLFDFESICSEQETLSQCVAYKQGISDLIDVLNKKDDVPFQDIV